MRGVLVVRVLRETGGPIKDEQESFRSGRSIGCMNGIFPLHELGEKVLKRIMYLEFMDSEKLFDKVTREALRNSLKMSDMGQ